MAWITVVKKDQFKVGDMVVFIAIDTELPETPWSEFLRHSKFRVKTQRIRGVLSQGLTMPLDEILMGVTLPSGNPVSQIESTLDGVILNGDTLLPLNTEIGHLIGVKHYEKPVPGAHLGGEMQGNFPSSVRKTYETNIKGCTAILSEMLGKDAYITVKCDGTSSTFAHIDNVRYVCGRNWAYKESETNVYWQMYHKYNIQKIFASEPDNLAIQGEICGPGIHHRNRLQLKELQLFVFDVFNPSTGRYLGYPELEDFCDKHGLQMVPLLTTLTVDESMLDLSFWMDLVKGNYKGTENRREGIVVRSTVPGYSRRVGNRLSFKVLNDDFLEKDED
jgi:RNA ligase (TIGR02306 family)